LSKGEISKGATSNEWNLYYFRIFEAQLIELKEKVVKLKAKDPEDFKSHKLTKLLASVYNAILEDVPTNPADSQFLLGNTLGKGYRHWKRVKKGLPNRYRLFFRYENKQKVIMYVWMNDQDTLRKEGSKTDVYAVFEKMLTKGDVPDAIDDLLEKDYQE